MSKKVIGRSPNYYIRKRFFRYRPAVFGLIFISLALLVALLGYSIMPDSTPDANDGAVQIRKKPVGFSVSFLKIRKNYQVKEYGFFHKALYGQENQYTIIPIESYQISGSRVLYQEYGSKGKEKNIPLVEVVYPIFIGDRHKLSSGKNYEISGDQIRYINLQGETVETTLEETIFRFNQDHIEKRTYWLGTDRSGRDLLSRLMFGTRISLSIGFVAVIISMFLGLGLGSIAGFWGGDWII